MKNAKIQLIAITLSCCLWAGCVGYQHKRTVKADGSVTERSTLLTLFKKGEAEMIQSRTVDNKETGYLREVGVSKIATAGDPASIEATGTAGGKIAGEAAKTMVKPGL